jgi:hypothetical protein
LASIGIRPLRTEAAPGKRRVIWGGEVYAPHPESECREPLGLTESQVEEGTQRQRGLAGDVGVLPLPSRVPTPAGSPVAIASGDTHRVTSPRPTRARS